MSSGSTAQDSWKALKQSAEARYIHEKEQAQLAAIRDELAAGASTLKKDDGGSTTAASAAAPERDFEGGFGGQEDLEDRYATTSGEH